MDSGPYLENKKYKDLINTAQELFFKHGTKRVTIEEICEKADVSKVTFYKFFRNKEDILKLIIKRWVEHSLEEYNEIMKQRIPFIDKVEALFKFKMSKTQEYSDDFFDEIIGSNEEIRNFFFEKTVESRQRVLKFYEQGRKDGCIRKNIQPEFYIYLMDHFVEMMNDEKLKAILPDPHDRFEELMNFFFYGFNDSEKKLK